VPLALDLPVWVVLAPHPALLPEMVASAVSRASQAEPRAARVASQVLRATLVVVQALVQAQAQVDLRALLLARGFLISVHLPGDQPVVTLMPLLRPRLLPKLLVL
jgi:hypothetical protein